MIKIVDGKPYLAQVKELILEYIRWLGRDLSFQNLDKELAAIHLYKKHGFTECEPYYHNPMDDVIYMSKELV